MQLFCIYFIFYPVHSTNAQVIKALGLSKIYIYRSMFLNFSEIILLIISILVFREMFYIALSSVISILIMVVYCIYQNYKLVSYSLREQLTDIFNPVILSIIAALCTFVVDFFVTEGICMIIAKAFLGALVYLALLYFFMKKDLLNFIQVINQIKNGSK